MNVRETFEGNTTDGTWYRYQEHGDIFVARSSCRPDTDPTGDTSASLCTVYDRLILDVSRALNLFYS